MPALAFADGVADGDEDLMLAYAAGDATAFDTLYARHKGGVYRYLVRHCGNAGIADELFQDIWMSVIRVRATYAPTREVHDVALPDRAQPARRSLARERARRARHRRRGRRCDDDPLDAIPGARNDEPEVRVGAREIGARLAAALSALPPAQREVFLLHQEGGLELSEIAALTGAGVETVKSRIRYALAKLRAELGDLQ